MRSPVTHADWSDARNSATRAMSSGRPSRPMGRLKPNAFADSALKPADAVILAVSHDEYVAGGWSLVVRLLKDGRGVVLDVKSKLDRAQRPKDIDLWRL